MIYKLDYSKKAQKQLRKLDPHTRKLIGQWLGDNIANTINPWQHGKALKANLAGYWRYRVENYRIICDIQDDKLVALAVEIAHRRDVYK